MTVDANPKVLRGVISIGSSNVMTLALTFITVSISARVLPEDDFGIYFLLLTTAYLFQVMFGLGIKKTTARFVASAPTHEDRQTIINTVLTLLAIIIGAASLLALVSRPVIVRLFDSRLLASLYYYAPLMTAVTMLDQNLDAIMQGAQLYRSIAVVQAISGILHFVLTVVFLLVFEWQVAGLALATILSGAIISVLRLTIIPGPKRLQLPLPLVRRMVRFGLPLQGNDILTFVSERLDIVLTGALLSPTSVAYLGVALKIPQNLYRVFDSVFAVYYPHTARLFGRGERQRAEDSLAYFLRLTSFITMGGALVIILFQREIVVLIFSGKYTASAPALALMMVVFTLSIATSILDYTLISAGHPGYMPFISLADTVPSVIANLLLIPSIGFMGAVYARLIANMTTMPVALWGLRRERIRVRIRDYLCPLVLLGACLALHYGLGWRSLSERVLLLALFGGLSLNFSVITVEDLRALFRGLAPILHPQAVPK